MAEITVPWNPYQDLVDAHIPNETIAVTEDRVEYVPRMAPFFSNKFTLKVEGSSEPLVFGKDYVFGHMFEKFILEYKSNAFGSIILITPLEGTLIAEYDSIGEPLVLDDVAFAEYVANVVNEPREANWEDLNPDSIPETFPVPPHEQPVAFSYNYEELLIAMRSLIIAMSYTTGGATIGSLLTEHLTQAIPQAHECDLEALALEKVPNIPRAVTADLAGGSDNRLITVSSLKESLRQFQVGTLPLD